MSTGFYNPPMPYGPQQPPYQPYPPMNPPYQPVPVAVPVPTPMVVPNPMCPRCKGTGRIVGGHKCSCIGGDTKLHTSEKVGVGLGVTGAVLGVISGHGRHGPHGPHGPHW